MILSAATAKLYASSKKQWVSRKGASELVAVILELAIPGCGTSLDESDVECCAVQD